MNAPLKAEILAWLNAFRAFADDFVAEEVTSYFASVEGFSGDWTEEEAEDVADKLVGYIEHSRRLNAMSDEETAHWEAAGMPDLSVPS